jgi:hypothetical protein
METLINLETALNDKFLSQSKFSSEIENIVKSHDMTYIEAIVQYCEDNNLDVESVPKLLSKPLKERIKCEAIQLNCLRKSSRAKLPL